MLGTPYTLAQHHEPPSTHNLSFTYTRTLSVAYVQLLSIPNSGNPSSGQGTRWLTTWLPVRHQPSNSLPFILTPTAAPPDRRPLVISCPSGAGKETLTQNLIDAHPNTFELTVFHTAREPSYHFVSVELYNSLESNRGPKEDAMYTDDFCWKELEFAETAGSFD